MQRYRMSSIQFRQEVQMPRPDLTVSGPAARGAPIGEPPLHPPSHTRAPDPDAISRRNFDRVTNSNGCANVPETCGVRGGNVYAECRPVYGSVCLSVCLSVCPSTPHNQHPIRRGGGKKEGREVRTAAPRACAVKRRKARSRRGSEAREIARKGRNASERLCHKLRSLSCKESQETHINAYYRLLYKTSYKKKR